MQCGAKQKATAAPLDHADCSLTHADMYTLGLGKAAESKEGITGHGVVAMVSFECGHDCVDCACFRPRAVVLIDWCDKTDEWMNG